MLRDFQVIIEKDEDGMLIAEVPSLRSCYCQAKTYDQLMSRIKEVIELCLEVETDYNPNEFIGIQKVSLEVG